MSEYIITFILIGQTLTLIWFWLTWHDIKETRDTLNKTIRNAVEYLDRKDVY